MSTFTRFLQTQCDRQDEVGVVARVWRDDPTKGNRSSVAGIMKLWGDRADWAQLQPGLDQAVREYREAEKAERAQQAPDQAGQGLVQGTATPGFAGGLMAAAAGGGGGGTAAPGATGTPGQGRYYDQAGESAAQMAYEQLAEHPLPNRLAEGDMVIISGEYAIVPASLWLQTVALAASALVQARTQAGEASGEAPGSPEALRGSQLDEERGVLPGMSEYEQAQAQALPPAEMIPVGTEHASFVDTAALPGQVDRALLAANAGLTALARRAGPDGTRAEIGPGEAGVVSRPDAAERAYAPDPGGHVDFNALFGMADFSLPGTDLAFLDGGITGEQGVLGS